MIFVKRQPAPAFLAQALVSKLRRDAENFYGQPLKQRNQRRFDFAKGLMPLRTELREALMAQFERKCAYCESPLGASSAGEFDWFRPRGGVSEASGGYLGDHYWRQAFEWQNMYLSCPICNRNKANRFPVEGPRAPADADRRALAAERPLLLDPCADDPAQHLHFEPGGNITGLTPRGMATVEILGLNRPDLLKTRQLEASLFLATKPPTAADMLSPERPYLALKRQLQRDHGFKTVAKVSAARAAQKALDVQREAVGTDIGSGLEQYRTRARHIERLCIENIASIKRLELNLATSQAAGTPCFAVLGSNGVGKSTLLKALALTLCGPSYLTRLGLAPKELLRDGAAEGKVTVWIGGYTEPVEMVLKRRGGRISFRQAHSRMLVLGYGASRLLPTSRHRPRRGLAHAKIDNLFDPFLPLSDAQAWLRQVPAAHFDDAARTLRALLPIEDSALILPAKRASQAITVQLANETPRPFSQLSDGYQSMLGLAADIMEIMYAQGFDSMLSAQGVVLIDELGNHLHPAWRMRIVGALRAAFPQVQFIFSTHDPLCLRGLENGEVAVLRRDRKREVYALEDLPSIAGLRVDQLLTSEHFGLDSTLDPQSDQDIRRCEALAVMPKRDKAQQAEYETLKASLTDVRLLGSSRRERLVLQAMDEELKASPIPTAPSVKASQLSREALDRLRVLLKPVVRTRAPRATSTPAGKVPR